ncbi:DUF4186 domain-containing protein [Phytohalomonas tamaricis]|uniref:DUF4186 domain-containing protein n=1 Tax=Phytohalomonas tamaricis TaxID=2081032 RepID=UPI0021D45DDC|nr:DUF4186 domain-containing protein [Phytohalomonas tamaricis]
MKGTDHLERGQRLFYTEGMTERMDRIDEVLTRLQDSAFRRKFRLGAKERVYLDAKGDALIAAHAYDFIARRLAPAMPPNDGKQTPWRGHPVFIAQHATGTCCRSCLAKWHGLDKGRALSAAEQAYVVAVIARWLGLRAADDNQHGNGSAPSPEQTPFHF